LPPARVPLESEEEAARKLKPAKGLIEKGSREKAFGDAKAADRFLQRAKKYCQEILDAHSKTKAAEEAK
jgi:hypothetical protein